jgi:hypothetical protein
MNEPSQTRDTDISIWYGTVQHCCGSRNPQRWYNVLGRVHRAGEVSALTARLNDGEPWAVSVGPDRRRLVALGDFNVELDVDGLAVGSNKLTVTAEFSDGARSEVDVEIVRERGEEPPGKIAIDWARDGIPNRFAQVVDGRWEVNGRYVTTRELGYDRLIAIGDVGWRDYEVLVPVVVHGMEARAYTWPSVHTGVGVVMRWKGHSNWGADEHASGQPRFGPGPYGAIGWWTTWPDEQEHLNFFDVDLRPTNVTPRSLRLNVPYMFRLRVESDSAGRSVFSMRVWEEDDTEPDAWDVTMSSALNTLGYGSLLLGAHETVASFGPVSIEVLDRQTE